MKKYSPAILRALGICTGTLVLTSALTVGASAAVGDVAGEIYETDIKTYFFGKRIMSYNIGGKTVVPAEDLMMLNLGYDYLNNINVVWSSQKRTLSISDGAAQSYLYENPSEAKKADTSERPLPNYPRNYFVTDLPDAIYETDIKTYFNTPLGLRELTSYNIGGKTCIVVEELMDCGYNVNWNAEARTLTVEHYFNNSPTELDIGRAYFNNYSKHQTIVDKQYTIDVNGKKTTVNGIMHGAFNFSDMLPLDEICELTGLKYTFDGKTLSFDTRSAREFELASVSLNKIPELYPHELFHIDIDTYLVDDKELAPTYQIWIGHFENSRLETFPADVLAYNGKAYIKAEYLQSMIKNRRPEYIAADKAAEECIPYYEQLCEAYEMLITDSQELECDSTTQITASFGVKTAKYNKVTDKRFDELGIETLDDITEHFEKYFSKDFVNNFLNQPSGLPTFIENNGDLYKLNHNFEKFGEYDTYFPVIYLKTLSSTADEYVLQLSVSVDDELRHTTLTFLRDGENFVCDYFYRFNLD